MMTETQERIEFGSLPAVEEVGPKEVRDRIVTLLETLDAAVSKRLRMEAVEEDCKAELAGLQATLEKPGFRYGLLCFVSQTVKGRKSLDRMLLIEHGVAAKTIADCHVEGKASVRRTFRRLPED